MIWELKNSKIRTNKININALTNKRKQAKNYAKSKN